jgi:epsilon-lactone hydrolase
VTAKNPDAIGGSLRRGDAAWLTTHPLTKEDSVAATALKSAVAPVKGVFDGVAGRQRYDDLMQAVAAPPDVTFEAATIGGIPGWWARTAVKRRRAAIMYIHGGWFALGTAKAYRNFAGHIAVNAGTDTFVPDYGLSPEHPFPAAVRDLEACYQGLADQGNAGIAVVGDSAGGNLALVLLSIVCAPSRDRAGAPVGAVVFSPVTDLALTGDTYQSRADAEFYFTRAEAATLAGLYLGTADPRNPLASPLYADLSGLPPVRVQVGDAEVLLDDARRYVGKAFAAGVDAKLDLWMGMPHGFVTGIGLFSAAGQALDATGAFLAERLGSGTAA